jgi:sporulation protein YlmC with PRC-barrel domain
MPNFLRAADQAGDAQSSAAKIGGQIRDAAGASAEMPTDINKASKLIGMDVKNPQNQKLGTIRDVVIDFKSQRVAYAWLEKADEEGNTGKYLAVPINVLQPSTDLKDLVLNADKNKIATAQGFAKNQLPPLQLPSNQTAFWQSIQEASGAQRQPQ